VGKKQKPRACRSERRVDTKRTGSARPKPRTRPGPGRRTRWIKTGETHPVPPFAKDKNGKNAKGEQEQMIADISRSQKKHALMHEDVHPKKPSTNWWGVWVGWGEAYKFPNSNKTRKIGVQ